MILASSKTRSRFDPSPYEKKIAELGLRIQEEARRLQDVVEARDTAIKDVATTAERKSSLLREIANLEAEVIKAKAELEDTIQKKSKFIGSSESELTKLKNTIPLLQKVVESLVEEVEQLQKQAEEFREFALKKNEARLQWLEERGKAETAVNTYSEFSRKAEEEKKEIEREKAEIEKAKEGLRDFSGRLTSHLNEIREATKYVNEEMKAYRVPYQYELPPEEIKIIPF